MNKIELPKSFKLNGNLITVEFDNKYCDAKEIYGEANMSEGKITLSTKLLGKKLSKKDIEGTFYHELVHHILHHSREDVIKYNEEFVEKIAQLFYEFEKTRNAK